MKNNTNELCAVSDSALSTVKPKYTVRQHDEVWELSIEVPGSKKNDVDIAYEDGILDVRVRRSDDIPDTWRPINFVERPREYRLCLDVPESIAADKIEAKLKEGVLHLDLPVSEAVKPLAIEVK